MTRPMISLSDGNTGESVIREMNDAEFAQYELDKAEAEATEAMLTELNAAAEAKKAAKAQALAALGLSQEVVNLLAE